MSVFHKTAMLCLLLALSLLFAACNGQGGVSAEAAVLAMCQAEKPLPDGKLYVRSAASDDEKAISDTLLSALYGNGSLPPELDEVSDAAFYFSYTSPVEFAAFRCKSSDGTEAVAALCHQRLDILRSVRTEASDTAYLDRAEITVCGKWVLFCISSDTDAVIRAFKRL